MDRSGLQAAALNASANGILIVNREGQIEWANPAMRVLTGYLVEEMIGQNPRLFRSGRHPQEYYQQMWSTILSGRVWQGETINRRKDGSLYVEEQTITPIKGESGEVAYFIAIKQDISQRKAAEQELERINQELLALSKTERAQARLAESLFTATLATDASLELEEVFDRILEQTVLAIPSKAALVIIEEAGMIRVVRQRGLGEIPELVSLLAASHSVQTFRSIARLVERLEPVIVSDIKSDEDRQNIPGLEWVRSYAAAPLVIDNHFAGAIGLLSDQVEHYNPATIDYLRAFASHAALAVDHARLYNAEQHARQIAERLSTAIPALTESLELKRVADTLLNFLSELITYDQAAVLISQEEKLLKILAQRGWQASSPQTVQVGSLIELHNLGWLERLIENKRAGLVEPSNEPGSKTELPFFENAASWLCLPLVSGGDVIGVCVLGKRQAGFYNSSHLQLAEALVSPAAVIIQNAWLFEQVRAGRESLSALSHRQVELNENERRYVARELHDDAGQVMTSLRLGLGLLERQVRDTPAVLSTVADLKCQVEELWERLHRLSADLHPAGLDHLGLASALRQYLEEIQNKVNLKVNYVTLGFEQPLPYDLEINIYRIVQEALNNVIRHAQATRVDVLLERRKDCLIVIIEDNGVGFDLEGLADSERLGLVGMRERAEMLNGKLSIESHPQVGTTIYVEVPYGDTHSDR